MPKMRLAKVSPPCKGKFKIHVEKKGMDDFDAKADKLFTCVIQEDGEGNGIATYTTAGVCSGIDSYQEVAVVLGALEEKVDTGSMITGISFWLEQEHPEVMAECIAVMIKLGMLHELIDESKLQEALGEVDAMVNRGSRWKN